MSIHLSLNYQSIILLIFASCRSLPSSKYVLVWLYPHHSLYSHFRKCFVYNTEFISAHVLYNADKLNATDVVINVHINIISCTDQHLGLSFTQSFGKISVIKCKKWRMLIVIFRPDHLIQWQRLAPFKTQSNRIFDCLYTQWRKKFKFQDAMYKFNKMGIASKLVMFTNSLIHQ